MKEDDMTKEPTKKQMEVLVRISPGPLGRGMKVKEAAKDLGISISTLKSRLQRFKAKYPEAWENFISLREISRQDRYRLRWKRHPSQKVGLKAFTELGEEIRESGFRSRILE
jgi:hypothetical protein